MMTNYAKLVNFTTVPSFGLPSEARITKKVYDWIGVSASILTNKYKFIVTYNYNPTGVAVSATVCSYFNNVLLGCADPFGNVSLQDLINNYQSPNNNQPSDFPSEQIGYFDIGYIEDGYIN